MKSICAMDPDTGEERVAISMTMPEALELVALVARVKWPLTYTDTTPDAPHVAHVAHDIWYALRDHTNVHLAPEYHVPVIESDLIVFQKT